MTSEKHLHLSDILAFRERHLSATDHTAATRHLLLCPECRSRLPLPTADELWRAVMGDDEETHKTTGIVSAWISAKDYFAGTIFGQFANRNVVFPGLLLFAIFGYSLFLMVPGGSSENEDLVATVGNAGSNSDIHSTNSDGPFSHPANTGVSTSSSDSRSASSQTQDRTHKKTVRAGNEQTSQRTHSRNPARTASLRQAETRGNVPCAGQRSISLGAKHTDAGLLLTWEKVRGAVTYNVYLSDLDERLIDHFETAGGTSHLVTAALDSETVYRLRLIANLENGERVVSESQNLKISDLTKGLQSSGNIDRKKTSASVRCVEAKQ